MVDSFAVVAGRPPYARAERHMTARSDEDLLAAVIDEVIYWLDAHMKRPVKPLLSANWLLSLFVL